MDPLAAIQSIAEVAKLALTFGMKVYDDTPLPIRQQGAADWGQFVHNTAKVILDLQEKLTMLMNPPAKLNVQVK